MIVKDVMTKNVITCEPEDVMSAVLAKMDKYKIHQMPAVKNGALCGIVNLKNLVIKRVDPETTKVESMIRNCPTIGPDQSVEKAVELLLQSGLRAIPVLEKGRVVGMISETDLIKISKEYIKNKAVKDVMSLCDYISIDDDIAAAENFILDKNVSRVPVMDKGKIVGVIEILDMIKIRTGKRVMPARGGRLKIKGAVEKVSPEKLSVKNIMKAPIFVEKGLTLGSVIFSNNEEVFVEDEGNFYIVTPKDILETMVLQPKRGIYVQITNLLDEEPQDVEKMQQSATEFVQKIGKMLEGNIQGFVMHIERHHKSGRKIKYSVRCRFATPLGLLVSHAWGWELVTVAQESINKLEREFLKHYGKMKDHKKKREKVR